LAVFSVWFSNNWVLYNLDGALVIIGAEGASNFLPTPSPANSSKPTTHTQTIENYRLLFG
jgi:hypothetical protein